MNELPSAAAWLKAKLAGDPTLVSLVSTRIYRMRAPAGSAYPVVVYQPMAATDIDTNGGTRVLTRAHWLVKAIATSYDTARQVANRIDAALQAASGTADADTYVPGCVRMQPIDLPEDVVGDLSYYQVGGVYRLDIHGT